MKLRTVWWFGAALAAAGAIATGSRLHRRWGATGEEQAAPLPGDELVQNPAFSSTRAITIQAPPSAVWPWLVQVGMGRAGWYSYDSWAAKVSSAPTSSASTVIADLQDLKNGDVIDLIDSVVFRVHDIRPERALVLAGEYQVPLQPWRKSWAFVLEPVEGGATRLLVRERSAWERRWVGAVTATTNWLWFFATRRMLKNLKALVEAS
ncbi:MAG: hypothetical protein LBJ02_09070 [Bifidobacteriaceae bacterium]|jgi:hypothetical protein|nr:hypothetical protein [Bifidobacteriaceae bacterium]